MTTYREQYRRPYSAPRVAPLERQWDSPRQRESFSVRPMRRLAWRCRAWRGLLLCWFAMRYTVAAVLVSLSVLALFAWIAWLCTGCARTDQQRILTVLTEAAGAMLPALAARIEAEEGACLELDTYADARACVDKSRAHWAPALAAVDVLLAVDRAAIDGKPDLAMALAAYCDLALAWPSLPAPPGGLGCTP